MKWIIVDQGLLGGEHIEEAPSAEEAADNYRNRKAPTGPHDGPLRLELHRIPGAFYALDDHGIALSVIPCK